MTGPDTASADREVRQRIYDSLAATGAAPTRTDLGRRIGSDIDVNAALRRLHDAHAIVLDAFGSIRMALPFSAVPTAHVVRSGARRWWANCAWDALAVPVVMGIDATIDASWLDDDAPVDLAVRDGRPTHTDGFVHFAHPAARWWDDIVET